MNKLTSKVLWLKTWTGHYAVWLVENKQKAKHWSEHTQHNQKQGKVLSGDDLFLEKMDIHPTNGYNTLGI